MAKPRILNIIIMECAPGDEAEFNKWYNDSHIPMLLDIGGFQKVTRYRIKTNAKEKPRFAAVYEFDNQEALDAFEQNPRLKDAMEDMNQAQQRLSFDLQTVLLCEPIKAWEK
jgi:antibiotic biosynthesis monooxygenase (ABM) superfamily enzyme